MPEPNNRPPWRIEGRLQGWSIGALIAGDATIQIQCDACHRNARWEPADLGRRFARAGRQTLAAVAPRLRCGRCRSNWIRVGLAPGSTLPAAPAPPAA